MYNYSVRTVAAGDRGAISSHIFYKCPLLLANSLQIYRILSMSVYLYIKMLFCKT
ncbi:hypothetical protein TcasGA2_TC034548 [Tribolium castaneum]|uniref:Uncharacterized protein n=1 Tax=Tribolium castaneum TaxID=7070 RepID=A0A139WMK8_TRICA|nr:hypothetical protein TcasGA2_TC034548 [Tribolium castaneum]